MSLSFAEIRESLGLSVEELSDILCVSAKTVYRWEKGQIVPKPAFLHVMNSMLDLKRARRPRVGDFTFIDLFAGIGGMFCRSSR